MTALSVQSFSNSAYVPGSYFFKEEQEKESPMIELENIEKEYIQGTQRFQALRNINLKIKEGECLAVVGKSGCGKTTLLNLIAGLLEPGKGTIRINEKEVRRPEPDVSIVFQQHSLFPWKTIRKNLLLPLQFRRERDCSGQVDEMLAKLELTEQADSYVCQLSGGQIQRAAIGRALLCKKKILLLDEPFSAIDLHNREHLQNTLRTMFRKKEITSVIVTHDLSEAVFMGDRIAVFSDRGKEIRKVIDNPAAGFSDRTSSCHLTVKRQIEDLMTGDSNASQS